MNGDAGMHRSINESLSLTQNTLATSSLTAATFVTEGQKIQDTITSGMSATTEGDAHQFRLTLRNTLKNLEAAYNSGTFNGDSFANSSNGTWRNGAWSNLDMRSIVVGISRGSGSFETVNQDIAVQPLKQVLDNYNNLSSDIDSNWSTCNWFTVGQLETANGLYKQSVEIQGNLGISEGTIESQRDFLYSLTGEIDRGVGAMVDADIPAAKARLDSLQVQQEMMVHMLSIANSRPQNILKLFQ